MAANGFEQHRVGADAATEHDGQSIRDLICFFNERVDLEIDGLAQERPETQWSH